MSTHTRSAVVFGLVLLLATASSRARAGLIASETFAYPTGLLNGQTGGTGWANAWTSASSQWTVTSPGLQVAGLKITSPDNAITCASTGGNRDAKRTLASAASGVIYFGAIIKHNTGGSHSGTLSFANDVNYGFKIGWSGAASSFWNLAIGGTGGGTWATAVNSAVPVEQGVPILAVVKLDIPNKTGYLYINQSSEGTPDAIATGGRCGVLSLSLRGAGNGSTTVDDLRIGTRYDEVTGIPPKRTVIMIY